MRFLRIDDHGMMRAVSIDVVPVSSERWPDLEAVFQARGCAMARGCWCMEYRRSGPSPPVPAGRTRRQVRRDQLRRLTRRDPPPGLLAYRDGAPVGWISLGPRDDFARLRRSPVMKAVDDRPVWSIVCFVVPAAYRRQGVADALLDGAIGYTRGRGVATLEAYPVDKPAPSTDDSLWFGVKAMYDRVGFVEVARRKPTRPVMRLELAG